MSSMKDGDASFNIDELLVIEERELLINFAGKDEGAVRVDLLDGRQLLYLGLLGLLGPLLA